MKKGVHGQFVWKMRSFFICMQHGFGFAKAYYSFWETCAIGPEGRPFDTSPQQGSPTAALLLGWLKNPFVIFTAHDDAKPARKKQRLTKHVNRVDFRGGSAG
jgi:hypothetical protein